MTVRLDGEEDLDWIHEGDGAEADAKADWSHEEGPRGGDRWVSDSGDVRYTEPAGWDDEGGDGPADVVGEENVTVDAEPTAEQSAAMADGLGMAAELVDLESIADDAGSAFYPDATFVRIREDTNLESPAVFDPEKGQLVFSQKDFTRERAEEFADEHVMGEEAPLESIVLHEAGHAAHRSMSDLTREEAQEAEIPADLARDELSERAASSPLEFIAEAFVHQAYGGELNERLQELYDNLGGPEI